MPQTPIDFFVLLMLLLGYPIGRSFEIFTERLLLKPYPRNAWGSWLLVGWAVGLLIVVMQFVLGTFTYADRLKTDFLSRGIPTLLYAAILLSLINEMFPEPPKDVPPAFLLTRFRENYRRYYVGGFLLALNPFILGFTLFQDPLVSANQIFRVVWMVCFTVGYFLPLVNPKHLAYHKILWAIAFPLITLMFIMFARPPQITVAALGICPEKVVERLQTRGFTEKATRELCEE